MKLFQRSKPILETKDRLLWKGVKICLKEADTKCVRGGYYDFDPPLFD